MNLSSSSQSQDHPKERSRLDEVLEYHNRTKHHFNKYARGPGGLDWVNQPNPFRRYADSPLIHLRHLEPNPNSPAPLYSSLFLSPVPPKPVSISSISQLFYDSLALSAWKKAGPSTWSLRVNPSSGNLHPTEAYLIAGPIDSVSSSPFVAHYAPKEHALEVRAELPSGFFKHFNFPENSFLVGFSSIYWREAWKYGERAFRYCNHDVGHAIAAMAMAAASLGWDVKLLDALGYAELQNLMGLGVFPELKIPNSPVKGRFPEIELEHPDCVLIVFPNGEREFNVDLEGLKREISELCKLDWKGKPNSLSKEHVVWDTIYKTSESVKKPLKMNETFSVDPFQQSGLCSDDCYGGITVREVVRKRRSAVDMDGTTMMHKQTFYQMLLHCLPSGSMSGGKQLALPFRALSWDSEVHAVLFVHRVTGLSKGLYFLVRNDWHLDHLRRSMREEFRWEKPGGCPENLPLYQLVVGDFGELSMKLSCLQEIASDGCFSLGMVARMEPTLREKGEWMYPRLYWEAGVLGHVLYLEAHAVGISGTGIGCFFDDAVHEVLGLKGSDYQSLYHFTVGSPVIDKRIMSLPAYPGPPNVDDA
ncbi:hypothetical protein V2J09_003866 [Rumex salicifolius]